jgi:hypothetical protein
MKNRLSFGQIEVPEDYLELGTELKKELCEELVDALLKVLDKQLNPELDRIQFLTEMLDNSIEENIRQEQYELCQVLNDLRTLINE